MIDTATNTVIATVAVGRAPEGIDITPDGAFAYVANALSNTVSVLDTATNTVVATIPGFILPRWIAITPNGAFAYVTNGDGSTVAVIDTATNTVTATIQVGSEPRRIDITPDGAFAYVAVDSFDNVVVVISTATNTVIARVSVPDPRNSHQAGWGLRVRDEWIQQHGLSDRHGYEYSDRHHTCWRRSSCHSLSDEGTDGSDRLAHCSSADADQWRHPHRGSGCGIDRQASASPAQD